MGRSQLVCRDPPVLPVGPPILARGCRQVQRRHPGPRRGQQSAVPGMDHGVPLPRPAPGRQALQLAGAWRPAGTCGQGLHRGDGVGGGGCAAGSTPAGTGRSASAWTWPPPEAGSRGTAGGGEQPLHSGGERQHGPDGEPEPGQGDGDSPPDIPFRCTAGPGRVESGPVDSGPGCDLESRCPGGASGPAPDHPQTTAPSHAQGRGRPGFPSKK